MEIKVNGEQEALDKDNLTIMDYIEEKGEEPESVVVEYNGEILDREEWSHINLRENDKLEILKFIGGGEKNE